MFGDIESTFDALGALTADLGYTPGCPMGDTTPGVDPVLGFFDFDPDGEGYVSAGDTSSSLQCTSARPSSRGRKQVHPCLYLCGSRARVEQHVKRPPRKPAGLFANHMNTSGTVVVNGSDVHNFIIVHCMQCGVRYCRPMPSGNADDETIIMSTPDLRPVLEEAKEYKCKSCAQPKRKGCTCRSLCLQKVMDEEILGPLRAESLFPNSVLQKESEKKGGDETTPPTAQDEAPSGGAEVAAMEEALGLGREETEVEAVWGNGEGEAKEGADEEAALARQEQTEETLEMVERQAGDKEVKQKGGDEEEAAEEQQDGQAAVDEEEVATAQRDKEADEERKEEGGGEEADPAAARQQEDAGAGMIDEGAQAGKQTEEARVDRQVAHRPVEKTDRSEKYLKGSFTLQDIAQRMNLGEVRKRTNLKELVKSEWWQDVKRMEDLILQTSAQKMWWKEVTGIPKFFEQPKHKPDPKVLDELQTLIEATQNDRAWVPSYLEGPYMLATVKDYALERQHLECADPIQLKKFEDDGPGCKFESFEKAEEAFAQAIELETEPGKKNDGAQRKVTAIVMELDENGTLWYTLRRGDTLMSTHDMQWPEVTYILKGEFDVTGQVITGKRPASDELQDLIEKRSALIEKLEQTAPKQTARKRQRKR